MRKSLLLVFLAFLPTLVKADCSNEELIRLQRLTNNISTSYRYNEDENTFTVTFSNISPELMLVDMDNNKDYYREGELNIYNVKSGNYTYYVYAYDNVCYENELGIKNINLPYFNKYYNNEECQEIKNYKYCSKWILNDISYDTWHSNVMKYKKSLEKEKEEKKQAEHKKTFLDVIKELFIDLYVSNYYIFLPITIVALCIIIYLRNKIDQII